ncbi:MAG: hypothetical protein AAFX87_17745 [Bacteroidota bacterium]
MVLILRSGRFPSAFYLMLLISFSSLPLQAQEQEPGIINAEFEATVEETAYGYRANVGIAYHIKLRDTVSQIMLKGLAFDSAVFEKLVISMNAPGNTRFDSSSYPLQAYKMTIDQNGMSDSIFSVEISYEVLFSGNEVSKGELDIKIPVFYVDMKQQDTKEDYFTAKVSIPKQFHVYERFPTIAWAKSNEESINQYTFSLQVLPAMVRIKASANEPVYFTFYRTIDAAVILTLLIVGILCARFLKRQSA